MSELKYYSSIFLRRLPLFLPIVMVISAVSVIVAMTLPPAYESEMQLVVESPQIPDELAPSTVRIPPLEQLQIIRQRLLTRANLLDIARRLDVLPNLSEMNPDEIVAAMRARTNITTSSKRDEATLMWIRFEAPAARTAAAVLGEYLTLIQQEDAQFRQGRAGETLDFFEQQVEQLSLELDTQNARILTYKNSNTDALPETLEFRLGQQSELRNSLNLLDRDVASLTDQRQRLITLFESNERVEEDLPQRALTPEERQLEQLRAELRQARAVFSETSPRVTGLKAQIAQFETVVAEQDIGVEGSPEGTSPEVSRLDIQLSEIDSRLTILNQQNETARQQLDVVTASLERTPEVSIRLEELDRQYVNLQQQYALALDRLSTARTGELIEARSRGQGISVIEPPAIPSQPTKPNRILIAGGGVVAAILAGLAIVLLLEAVNNSARRPEDLVKRFEIMPISTIPFIRTRRQMLVQRTIRILFVLAILLGVPAAVYAVHTYYLPLDILAERLMNKIGVRL